MGQYDDFQAAYMKHGGEPLSFNAFIAGYRAMLSSIIHGE